MAHRRMDNLIFDKTEVIESLRGQLETHRTIVTEAWEGYKEQAEEQLQEAIDLVARGRKFTINIRIPAPQDHTKDIERAIKMLEMSQGDDVVLNSHEFAQYIMGDWTWQEEFLTSNSRYSMTAASSRS